MVRKFQVFFTFLILSFSIVNAYNYLPVVKSFDKNMYNAGRQNWDVESDDEGIVYFANNTGLLRNIFGEWELSQTLNKDMLRSICVHNDTIWSGGGMDYGYFVKDSPSDLSYHLIGNLISGDVWNIECVDNFVYFQTNSEVIAYDKSTKVSHHIKENNGFWGLTKWKGKIWTIDRQGNFGFFNGYKYIPTNKSKGLCKGEIRNLFELNGDLYILIFDGRLFKFDGNKTSSVELPKGVAQKAFFTSDTQKNGQLLLGSISHGLIQVDLNNNIANIEVNRQNGLLDNTVLSIGKDLNGNVWLGLDYGIAYIEMQNPLKSIFEGGATYDIVEHNKTSYLATNKGLFYSADNAPFTMLEGSDGQIWDISKINDQVYICHNKGIFLLVNNNLHPLFIKDGVEHIARFGDSPYFILTSYSGLLLVKMINNNLEIVKNLEIWGNPKIQFDPENNCIWADTRKSDLIQLRLSEDNNVEQHTFTSITSFFKGEKSFVFYNEKELLKFRNDKFTPIEEKPFSLVKGAGISTLDFDNNNNFLAYIQDGSPNLLTNLYDGNFHSYKKLLSSLSNSLVSYREFINLKGDELRIATETGVTTFNSHTSTTLPTTKSVISKIVASDLDSSLTYIYPYIKEEISLHKGNKDLIFYFGSIKSSSDMAEYRFKLYPFEKNWSQWSSNRSIKEYSNIKGGNYDFQLQCRLNGGEITESNMLITIKKHWYQTLWVLLPILLLLLASIAVITKILRHRSELKIKKELKVHKEELAQKTIGYKNEQLLQYTEVISDKNDFLSQLKDGLSRMRNTEARHWENKIEEEVNKEKKNFLFHKLFSEVHQDFINRLTEKHTSLTANDIRIISFIRINLGTKEIANLMNISPKSVDIARYRLRKKLDLAHENDLNKYIRDI